MEEYLIETETDLKVLAPKLIKFAQEEKVWIFKGEMGAGKTTFIRNICEVLEVQENVVVQRSL